ncbi:SH3 domain protein [Cladophialophora carrionii]|uniref:SH3 domain protein n=1 Tax=Cladophialophora carrionii TaxID=86049 RepID=A0A1C1CRE1_9EURO|nr:SH3 domain protein [Cladophialophora carrionii]
MPAVPFKVKAIYEYKSQEPDDLSFDNGQIITVTEDEDADWYTGEFVSPSGEKLEGIFPRNFVEKYEPAIPSRPVRAPRRAPAPEPSVNVPEPTPSQPAPPPDDAPEAVHAEEKEPPREPPEQARSEPEAPPPAPKPQPAAAAAPASGPSSAPSTKAPPPVAEKPTSSSFKDRIAAFNRPAAAPVAPFKPGGGGPSTGFIKKPFVAPPPSRNAYVPPPREPPISKPYKREEDPSVNEPDSREPVEAAAPSEPDTEDQPKPQSLKERIALLQKQQLEQAARNAEKKEKPKKPPKKRVETAESGEQVPQPAPGLTRLDSNETVSRPSAELAEGEHEPEPAPPSRRTTGLGTPQPQPSRELVSDTNDADDSGAADEDDMQETSTEEERPKSKGTDLPIPAAAPQKPTPQEQKAEDEEDEEEESEEEDPEIRRRRELRERMAKMSGGMGMMGMFGPPGGVGLPGAGRKPKSSEGSRQATESHAQEQPQERAAPIPIMALPGMAQSLPRRPEEVSASPKDDDDDDTAQPTPQAPAVPRESDDYVFPQPLQRRSTDRTAPPVPQDRAAPPPPPRDTRAAPPPPPTGPRAAPPVPQSPTSRAIPPLPPSLPEAAPETSGYEESEEPGDTEDNDPQAADSLASPPAVPPLPPTKQSEPPKLDTAEEAIYPPSEKRASRLPPPVPISPASPVTRAPPPPPPGAPPSRRSTTDSGAFRSVHSPKASLEDEEEVTEYEGDYDTDIASDAKHKDALRAHNRDSSLDEGMLTDDVKSPKSPPARNAPPLPPVSIPQDVPPPPPSVQTPKSRKSVDAPRAAPPPVPAPKTPENEEYDPHNYNYSAPMHAPPIPVARAAYSTTLQSPKEELEEGDMYGGDEAAHAPPPPAERPAPPPPPPERPEYNPPSSLAPPPPPGGSPEAPADLKRSGTLSRRSMDHSRGGEQGFIASDIDLGKKSLWWTQDNLLPPSLQGRPDILYEMEANSSIKRGGRTTISKDVYVLYMDYSQTTINASYESADPMHVTLEQNHERPPPAPRRDQLEAASEQYGKQMARVASGLAGTTVADGSARAFVLELLKPHTTALLPVGTRAYGALVYANLGNASTQQFDEIRPGDIVTFRNAKFSGHKGSLHQKYSLDVGKPEHVAVVIDWDGTKKKIRAWEQGRDLEKGKRPKVREESFKVGDLKSGEVMVWRVMPRTWVGWDTVKS